MTENTDDIKLRESRQKCLDILGKFYHILKKVDPYETAIQLANTIRSNFKNRSSDHVSQTFVYLFVIEASFYYNRPFYSTVPVLKYFNELIQLSIKLAESYHLYCIENKEIDLLVKGMHTPEQSGHPIRSKVDTQSGAKWTPNPLQSGQ